MAGAGTFGTYLLIAGMLAAPSAQAGKRALPPPQTSCAYAEIGAPGPTDNELRLVIGGTFANVSIQRDGSQLIIRQQAVPDFEGQPVACSGVAPTVDNIDRIALQTDGARRSFGVVTIGVPALTGGVSAEPDGAPEIEVSAKGAIVVELFGTPARDHVNTGTTSAGLRGADWNADSPSGDVDIEIEDGLLSVQGRGGNDVMSGQGGSQLTTTAPRSGFLLIAVIGGRSLSTFVGGKGNDLLTGGPYYDSLVGGPGRDVLRGAAGRDQINASEGADRAVGGKGRDEINAVGSADTSVNCGPGRDIAGADPSERLRKCEAVIHTTRRNEFYDFSCLQSIPNKRKAEEFCLEP